MYTSTLPHVFPTLPHVPPTLPHVSPTLPHVPPTLPHVPPTLPHVPPTLPHIPPTLPHVPNVKCPPYENDPFFGSLPALIFHCDVGVNVTVASTVMWALLLLPKVYF